MTTPLIILAILLFPLAIGALAGKITGRAGLVGTGGLIALALAFLFFAVGHFAITDRMVEMLPPFLPMRQAIVYGTGILEILLAAGLMVTRWRRVAGIFCILILVTFFSANVYAAINGIGPGGHQWGPEYLLLRAPLQILLIGWAYWFAVRKADRTVRAAP